MAFASSNGGVRAFQPTRVPVILANYNNVSFKNTDFNDYIASLEKYWSDNSFGLYTPKFDVIGPVTLSQRQKYYGENDGYGDDLRPDEMVAEACNLAEGLADFTQYDRNGDGKLDAVVVIYAGQGEVYGVSNEDAVWAYTGDLEESDEIDSYVVLDGKTVTYFSAVPELQSTTKRDGVGTLIHEFAHILGLPNLCTTNGGFYKTLGDWDVMDHGSYNNNSNTPAALSAYERFYLGWVEPILLDGPMNVRLRDLNTTGDCAIITASGQSNMNGINPDPREFYMLENRQQKGWDEYLPGHGLMLTKIDYVKNKWLSDEVNNIENHPCVDLIEADGSRPHYKKSDPNNGYFGKQKDLFPAGATEKKMFSNKMEFANVKEQNGVITFDFNGGVDKCEVVLYTGVNGSCEKESLTETKKGGGIVLPSVTAKSGFTFLGWSTRKNSMTPDAGKAGETFYPMSDCTLFAVLKDNTKYWVHYDLKGVTVEKQEHYIGFNGAYVKVAQLKDIAVKFHVKDGYAAPTAATCMTKVVIGGKIVQDAARFNKDTVIISVPKAYMTDDIFITVYCVREQKEEGCDTYEHTFTSSCLTGSLQDFGNYAWDVTIANENTLDYDKTKGAVFGSGTYPAGLVNFYTEETFGCAVAKVKVTAAQGSQGDAVVSVYSAGYVAGEPQALTEQMQTYEFIVENPQSGALEIRLENTKKAMYLKSFEISYTKLIEPEDPEPDPQDPDDPVDPEDPDDPDDPEDPENPENPDQPEDPENPDQPENPDDQGLDGIKDNNSCSKIVIDGQLYIRHNGQIYTILGNKITK